MDHDQPLPTEGTAGAEADRLVAGVVVPVHNGEATLHRCLSAIRRNCPDIQIIVADDASSDRSAEIARQHGATVVRTGDEAIGPAAARNLAAETLAADVVVFIDSDVELAPDTIDRLVAPLGDNADDHTGRIVASFGSYDDAPDSSNAASLYANLRHHHLHQTSLREAETFWAGCGAMLLSVFREAGGFDEGFAKPSIEDIELGMRLRQQGYHIRSIPEAQAKHLKNWNLGTLWRTDVVYRALPWSKLMLCGKGLTRDLNTSLSQRMSAVLIYAAVAALTVAIILGSTTAALLSGVTVGVWYALNRSLFRLLWRRGRFKGLIAGSMLHACYYVYASATLAFVWLTKNWSPDPNRFDSAAATRPAPGKSFRLGVWLTVIIVLVLYLSGITALAVSWAPDQWLWDQIRLLGKDPTTSYLSLSDINDTQRRARWAGIVYLATAGIITVIGPRILSLAFSDLRPTFIRWKRGLRLIATFDKALVLGAMLVLATGAVRYGSQPMRLDEAATFLNYAHRPLLVVLSLYDSTNNHLLHSALMWFSVRLFGDDPWSIRLPATLAMIACVPSLYLAGRRLFGADTALVATGIFGGGLYSVDLATNARGYPLVILTFLLMLCLLPDVLRRRPASTMVFICLAAAGAWAVPVMIYPFAGCVIWLLLRGLWWKDDRTAWNRQRLTILSRKSLGIFAVVVLVGSLVALLYLPTRIVVRNQTDAFERIIKENSSAPLVGLVRRCAEQLDAAFQLWTHPFDQLRGAIGLLVLVGLVFSMWKRRTDSVLLAVAMLIGCAAVLAITRFASPPFWSWAFLYPLLTLYLAVPLSLAFSGTLSRSSAPARQTSGPRQTTAYGVKAAALVALIAGPAFWWRSDYPRNMPFYVGFQAAPDAIIALDQTSERDVISAFTSTNVLKFYIERIDSDSKRVFFLGSAPSDFDGSFVAVVPKHGVRLGGEWSPPKIEIPAQYVAIKKKEYADFNLVWYELPPAG